MNPYFELLIITIVWKIAGIGNKYFLDKYVDLNPLTLSFLSNIIRLCILGLAIRNENITLEDLSFKKYRNILPWVILISVVSGITLVYFLPILKKEKYSSITPFRTSISIIIVLSCSWYFLGESINKNHIISMLFFIMATYFAWKSSK